ncbi:MAG: hypothetical protein AB7P03_22150 [Kofleriaceae bacterium]
MEVLRWMPFVALATACYSPELPECVVACNTDHDCAPDQRCGTSGFCAAAGRAMACSAATPVDAIVVDTHVDDPHPADASPDDAPPEIEVRIAIHGFGEVAVSGGQTCTAIERECSYLVTSGAQLLLVARPSVGWQLMRWQGGGCDAQDATCIIAPSTPVTIKAKFKPG